MRRINLTGITAAKRYPALANNPNVVVGLDFLQLSYLEVIAKLSQAMSLTGNPTILEGLAFTPPVTFPASPAMVSGGGVYIPALGEIFLYNGGNVTGSLNAYIACNYVNAPTDTVPNQTKLSDGSLVSIHNQRLLTFSYSSIPNSGNIPDYWSAVGGVLWVPAQPTINANNISILQNQVNPLIVGGWIAVQGGIGFQNSWGNYGSGNAAASFRIEGKYIALKGVISGGNSNTIAFTLPAGYLPITTMGAPCAAGTTFIANISVAPNGNVTVFFPSGTNFIVLDGIRIGLD